MKLAVLAVPILALFIASPFVDATPSTKRTAHSKPPAHAPIKTPKRPVSVRAELVRNHIRAKLGNDLAGVLFSDRRFPADSTLTLPPPPPTKPRPPRPRKHDYDYVFSSWSLERGKTFLEKNESVLDYEEAHYGIPREVINAFFNIETQWGKNTGPYPVFIKLYTLAVTRPNLVAPGWPEEQMITFLQICMDQGIDPFSIKGSRTGAFGMAQFEPTSYQKLAVHFGTDNKYPDLFSEADAICSIGNYLSRSGWGETETTRAKAVHAYNHDQRYVDAVLDYADLFSGTHPHRYHPIHSLALERAAIK